MAKSKNSPASSEQDQSLKVRVGLDERVQILVGEHMIGEAVRHAWGWSLNAADGQQHEVITLDGTLVKLGVLPPEHWETPADHPEMPVPDDEAELAR